MNKKIILFICVVSILSLLSYLGSSIVRKTKEKNIIEQQLQVIPKFELLTLDEKVFNNSSLKPNLYTIFIYFNSECDFCQHEAQSISDNLNEFIDVQFIFVSTESIADIQQFSEQYALTDKENITFLHDKKTIFSTQFDATSIPYILIYDKNQKLLEKRKGQLNASGILKILNQ